MRKLALRLTLLALLTPALSWAQDSNWGTSIGLFSMYLPKYQGSKHYRLLVVPNLSVTYKKRFFFSAARGLGVYFNHSKHWKSGAAIRYEYSNGVKRDNEFPGLNNIKNLFSINGFASYQTFPVKFGLNWQHGLNRWDLGNQLTAKASGMLPINKSLFITAGPSITFADRNYMQTYYGINAAQSASSGLTEHKVHAGISRVNLNASMFYYFDPRWSGALMLSATHYMNAVKRSPLIQRQLTWFAAVGVSYQLFGTRSQR